MTLNINDLMTSTFMLFAVIDIIGNVPVILQVKGDNILSSSKTTLVSGGIMMLFLFLGEFILGLIGIELTSFAIAGSVIIFLIAFEMVLGRNIFHHGEHGGASIVPIAFPMIAGVGTITTLLSMRATFDDVTVIIAILINLIAIFFVLKSLTKIEKVMGKSGVEILRKVFGVVLLAMAIQMFRGQMEVI